MTNRLADLMSNISDVFDEFSMRIRFCNSERNVCRVYEKWKKGYEISNQDKNTFYKSKAYLNAMTPSDTPDQGNFLFKKTMSSITEGIQYMEFS